MVMAFGIRYYLAITKHVYFDNIGTLGAHISWIYSNRFDDKLNNPAMGSELPISFERKWLIGTKSC